MPANFLSAKAVVSFEDEKGRYEADLMTKSERNRYNKKCQNQTDSIPDNVRNFFKDAISWYNAQYSLYVDYRKIKGTCIHMLSFSLLRRDEPILAVLRLAFSFKI